MLNSDQEKAKQKIKAWWFSDHQAFILGGRAGTGKAQPLDEPVYTVHGPKLMQDIQIGDYVLSEKGKPIKVLAVHDRPNVQMFKIVFSDGSSTRACSDHLWKVQTPKQRYKGNWSVKSTKELLDYSTPGKQAYRYSIPINKAVEFESNFPEELDFYALGYLLGNGSSTKFNLSFAVWEQDVANILANIKPSTYMSQYTLGSVCHVSVNKELRYFYSKELYHKKSKDKFIPSSWFISSIEQRKNLLAGLLDSDGCCAENKARFSSTSKKLSIGVIELIRSLGGVARLLSQDREDYIEYTVTFRLPFNPFKLKRKAKGYKVIKKDLANFKSIIRMDYLGFLNGKCITVDNETSLYLTKDYTVTHNSFLCNEILTELPGVKPLIIAPTHEALKQIKDKISFPDALFKTAHSSLGLAPIESEKDIKFEETKLPTLWDEVNLCIADEASMYHKVILKLLLSTKIKILFVGHKSQLPPVERKRALFDKCISPVFDYEFPSYDLRIPQRNTGKLWDFCNILEQRIEAIDNSIISFSFDITKKDLTEKIKTDFAIKIFNGETKFVLWTNEGVDRYNDNFRKSHYGEAAKLNKYLPGDKIILTQPYTNIEHLEKHNDKTLLSLFTRKQDLNYIYSNSKGTVLSCEEQLVKLNKTIHIPVYKLLVESEGEISFWYEPIYSQDHNKISSYYEHIAWNCKTDVKKKRAYKERHFIRSMFAHIKHFYAATAHRLQGSTISEVILIASDIEKNPCKVERLKCMYVAASRAKDNLYFYRGI